MSRKAVPDHERAAIAAEIRTLLKLRDENGARVWTTIKLAEACGGLAIETIRKAQEPGGVGPVIREAILAVTGSSMEELLRKHGIAPSDAVRLPRLEEISPAHGLAMKSSASAASGVVGPNSLLIARKVWTLLEQDGFPRELARSVVGGAALDDDWESELDLYRKARALLEESPSNPRSPTQKHPGKTGTLR